MKLLLVVTLLCCYIQRAKMNSQVKVLVGTTVFSSVENRQIRQCTSEFIENAKHKDGSIGSYIRNCTRNDPTPPSEGKVEPQKIMIIGSTAFPYDEGSRKCVNLLKPDVRNPGSEMKKCQDAPITTPSPGNRSVSGGHMITRKEGEEAQFTCDVVGMRKNDTFSWKGPRRGRKSADLLFIQQRGNAITPSGNTRLSFSSLENRTKWLMTIRQIHRTDAGEYLCEVKTTDSAGILHIENASFYLTVNYKVEIRGIRPNRYPYVRDGEDNVLYFNETDNATLICLSDGRPEPETFWRRGNGSDGEIYLSKNYTIYNISTEDEDFYWCEARQTLTKETRNVRIVVQHRPITSVAQPLIRSKMGKSVVLECLFDSDPLQANAVWYKKGRELDGAEPLLPDRSRYYIDSLDPDKHYGNYTCVVTNILGSNQCKFEITGRPAKPTITSPAQGSKMRVYTLEWTFEIYDIKNIDYFWVCYTKKDNYRRNSGDMLKLKVYPVIIDPKRPMHYKAKLHDLWDNATYCVELFAVNKYGQGDTAYFEFRTADRDAPTHKPTREPPPTPAGQHNGDRQQTTSSLYVSLGTAILIAGVLRP